MTPYRKHVAATARSCTLVGPVPRVPAVIGVIALVVAALGYVSPQGSLECVRRGRSGECKVGNRTVPLDDVAGMSLEPDPRNGTWQSSRNDGNTPLYRLVLETGHGDFPLEGMYSSSIFDGRASLVQHFDAFLAGKADRFPDHPTAGRAYATAALIAMLGVGLLVHAFCRRSRTRLLVDPDDMALVVTSGTFAKKGVAKRYALVPTSRFETQREQDGEWLVVVLEGSLKMPLVLMPKSRVDQVLWLRTADALLAPEGPAVSS